MYTETSPGPPGWVGLERAGRGPNATSLRVHIDSRDCSLLSGNPPPQINVANVDPEKGTYAVGDFKTVALAGYIRAKVRFGGLHVFVFDGAVGTTVGVGLLWVDGWMDEGPTEPMPLGSRILTTPCLSSFDTPHINQPNHPQGEADSALVEIVKKADSE